MASERVNVALNAVKDNVSLYQGFVLVVQIVVVVLLSILSPILVRTLCLPSLMYYTAPLYFTFDTCSDNLAGVCSFPTATVNLDQDGWELSEGIDYEVDIALQMSDVEPNKHLGHFQVVVEAFDVDDRKRAVFRRTAKVLKRRSLYSLAKQLTLMPMYMVGLLSVESELEVQVIYTERFVESADHPTKVMTVQVQNRLAEIEEGTITVMARFGLLRNFLFKWPLASSALICILTFSICISTVMMYWSLIGLMLYLRQRALGQSKEGRCLSNRSSIDVSSSGYHSNGSTESGNDKRRLKSATMGRKKVGNKRGDAPSSAWNWFKWSRQSTGYDGSQRMFSNNEATPRELAALFYSIIQRSPDDVTGDVINLIKSAIDGSLPAATAASRLRRLVDVSDCPCFSSVLRKMNVKSVPALQESVRKGEIKLEEILSGQADKRIYESHSPQLNSPDDDTSSQACGWGSRSIDKYLCTVCEEPLPLYDWLYLAFVTIVPLLLHSFFIHFYAPKASVRSQQVLQHVCCISECVLSGVISVLIMPPKGSLSLHGCAKSSIREWYPVLYNPLVNHTHTIVCNYEVVFPLYSFPFVYLALCLLSLVVLRSVTYATVLRHSSVSSQPYYAALYSIPLLAFTHALFAGALYYSFAWVTLVCSVALNAIHMAVERGNRLRSLSIEMLSRARNLSILAVHMALFGFSLFALMLPSASQSAVKSAGGAVTSGAETTAQMSGGYMSTTGTATATTTLGALATTLVLVPLPSVFYLLTVGLTNPAHVLDPS